MKMLLFLLSLMLQTCNRIEPLEISSITLSASPCEGSCPYYWITIHDDGKMKFKGEAFTKLIGDFTGTLDPTRMEHLKKVITSANIFELPNEYTSEPLDMPTYNLSVTTADGKQKKINDYGPSGPQSLRNIYAEIEKIIDETKWQEEPSNKNNTHTNVR